MGTWRTNPDFGDPGRRSLDPAARDIIRRYLNNGWIGAEGLGELGRNSFTGEQFNSTLENICNACDKIVSQITDAHMQRYICKCPIE
jgi:hypothetical protein